jgi:hypothetical protein
MKNLSLLDRSEAFIFQLIYFPFAASLLTMYEVASVEVLGLRTVKHVLPSLIQKKYVTVVVNWHEISKYKIHEKIENSILVYEFVYLFIISQVFQPMLQTPLSFCKPL